MKKLCISFMVFLSFMLTVSFGDTFLIGHEYYEETDWTGFLHVTGENGICTYCGGKHWEDGTFAQHPTCSHTTQVVPEGYQEIRRWTETDSSTCGNADGYAHTTRYCTLTYIEAEKPEPSPTITSTPPPTTTPTTTPTPTPTPTYTPTPPPPCPHINTYDEHEHNHRINSGTPEVSGDVYFYSEINSSEEERRKNPFHLNSEFKLKGSAHIEGIVEHDPRPEDWECYGYDAT